MRAGSPDRGGVPGDGASDRDPADDPADDPAGEPAVSGRVRFGAHLVVALVSGFCVMVLEFAAVRLLAPFFGQSNQVWANVIGAILLALSLGYWAGGRLGERSNSSRPLYVGYGLCACWTVLVALFGAAVCAALAPSGFGTQRALPLGFTGSLLSAFVLFCPPVFLLGMTSPFLIQMEARRGHEGRTTGAIYALGTLGSLLGCYLAPLEMLQTLGTRSTFFSAAALLGLLSALGLWFTRSERLGSGVGARQSPVADEAQASGRAWLIAVAALTGLAVTVIEFSAVRFMAPWFGQSNYVWANVIGVILLALALGSWLGGRWADRALAEGDVGGRVLYVSLSVGALLIVLVCLVGPALMEILIPQEVDGLPIDSMHVLPIAFRGSLVATVLFFGPALLLLGMVPPFLVRMGSAGGRAGHTAGVLLAWTTMGGLLGCFITAPLLVPWLGSRGTLLLAALGLGLMASFALRRGGRPAFATALVATLCSLAYLLLSVTGDAPLRTQPGQIAEVESAYQVIRVVRSKVNLLIPQETLDKAPGDLHAGGQKTDTIFLRHDEDAETYQSSLLVDPALSRKWLTGGRYFEHMALGAFFARPGSGRKAGTESAPAKPLRILIVGYAGGTVHRTLRDTLGPKAQYHILGVEIDPAVIDVARKYLRHRELEGEHLELVLGEDARTVVNALPPERRFDLVLVDAYTRTNYVPFQLASREFFQRLERHLSPGAWVGVNVLGTGLRSPVADAVANTMTSVFGRAFVAPNPAYLGNVILWASPGALRGPRVASGAQLHAGLKTAAFALERLLVRHDVTAGSGLILTDDLSPSDKLADIELGLFGRAGK